VGGAGDNLPAAVPRTLRFCNIRHSESPRTYVCVRSASERLMENNAKGCSYQRGEGQSDRLIFASKFYLPDRYIAVGLSTD